LIDYAVPLQEVVLTPYETIIPGRIMKRIQNQRTGFRQTVAAIIANTKDVECRCPK
jgi:hypothetical protein